MKTSQLITLSLLLVLLAPLAAGADSHEMGPKPLTWVSYVQSQAGQGSPLSQYIAEQGAKIYDPLMADGHVLAWGVAMPINHRAGDSWNVMEYVTFSGWAGVDAFMAAFMGAQMAKSPEEMKADQEKWYSLIEAGSHWDAIYRHQLFDAGDGSAPRYFHLGYYHAKPGKEQAVTKQFKKYVSPVMSQMVEDGAINSWGVAVPEVHGDGLGSHVFWWGMPNLVARETVMAGFEAAAKERGEEAEKASMEEFNASVDASRHHDRVMAVVHSGGSGGGGGEGGQ